MFSGPSASTTIKQERIMKLVLYICVLVVCRVTGQNTAPLITISDGQINGTANRTIRENVTYYSYRGIPFAKQPVGDLRFAAPVENDPWNDTLDATADRDRCVQIISSEVIGSENCLFINVYTTNVSGNLPVMVWIYGGGFSIGHSDYGTYGPDYFLEKGVIYVAFNYRLGVFGFLSTGDMEAPGNWGLKDQIMALKWVQRNINSFGGNPDNVTIFGQSAGAASVSYLVQSNLTQGLFVGAIMESGTSLGSWALTRNAKTKAFQIALKLDYNTTNTTELVQYLRTVNSTELKLAENLVSNEDYLVNGILDGIPIAVVEEPDHADAVLSSKSWELLRNGDFQRVPLIAGFNSDEYAYFIDSIIEAYKSVFLEYDNDTSLLAPYDLTEKSANKYLAGNEILNYFFNNESTSSNETALNLFLSNDYFWRPIREFVTLTSNYTNTYFYEFSYKGILGDPNGTYSGTLHAEELHYLFVYKGQGLYPNTKDYETIDKFVTLWTNFAKTGNPTPETNTSSVLGQLSWIPNNSTNTNGSSSINYLQINDTLYMDTNPFQSYWTFYQEIYSTYGDPPYGTY